MLRTTRGIVLHSVRYSDTSLVVKIYTESNGVASFMAKGVRSPKAKLRPALFQPMSMLEIVAYSREKQTLHTLKDARLAVPFSSMPFDIRKSSVALFINELVYRSVREEEPNPALFAFLWQSCMHLDAAEGGGAEFHLRFAMRLMPYLGFQPLGNYSADAPLFNMEEGLFQPTAPSHPHYLDREESSLFATLIRSCETEEDVQATPVFTSHAGRNRMLDIILAYYRLHLPGIGDLRSHRVLRDVLG